MLFITNNTHNTQIAYVKTIDKPSVSHLKAINAVLWLTDGLEMAYRSFIDKKL